ncbi:hypothetical protein LAUMK136_00675 [Mycobacterium attenuatum]|uniref:Uncharacterized protein n=1 Tax=Mycobacterium attenuatum TaxID=2341086 RepID=A0A498PR03_9MYCO|nr:hypothetical protein LAUMK136_00675 [Mycobacterium attenuatum]
MFLPVKIATNRPEEILEIGDVIPQGVRDIRQIMGEMVHVDRIVDDCTHEFVHGVHGRNGDIHRLYLYQHVVHTGFHELHIFGVRYALHADDKWYRSVLDGGPQRPGNRFDLFDTATVINVLGYLVQHQHVHRITHIVIGLDHQHLGVQPSPRKMPTRRRIADIGRHAGRHELAQIVGCLVAGQRQQTDKGDHARGSQNRPGPADNRRSHAPPSPGVQSPLGVEKPEEAADGQHGGPEGERRKNGDKHAYRTRRTERIEIRQPGKTEAIHGAGNGQTGAQDHMGGSVKHRVKSGLTILAGVASLVITPEHEYRVVRGGRNSQENQQVGRKRGKAEHVVIGEKRNSSPDRPQVNPDHDQDEKRSDHGTVNEKQHHRDHQARDRSDLGDTLVTRLGLVGIQCRRTGDIGFDTLRRRCAVHDMPDGVH